MTLAYLLLGFAGGLAAGVTIGKAITAFLNSKPMEPSYDV